MRPIVLVTTLLLLTLSMSAQNTYQSNNDRGGAGDRIRGNGDVTVQQRDLPGFSGVDACCNFRVEIVKDGTPSVRVEAESNLQEYIVTEVDKGRLTIRFREDTNIRTSKTITIFVAVPAIDYLAASSACRIDLQSPFAGKSLEVRINSGAYIDARFDAEEVRANVESGGHLELRGSGRQITAVAESGGQIEAGNYTAKVGMAEASSGGGVKINVSEQLRAEASSGGNVKYRGGAADIVSNASSGGSVRGN